MELLTKEEELRRWRQLPATQEFMRLMSDRLQNLTEAWASGAQLGPEAQAQASTLKMIINLTSEDVRSFYGIEEENGDS